MPNINKKDLLNMMNCMGFDIADIDFRQGMELVGKKMKDSDELVWWNFVVEGSGFERTFRGSIKAACL